MATAKEMKAMMEQMVAMQAMLTTLAQENAALKTAKPVTSLPEIKIEGSVKDKFLYIKVPIADTFTETFQDRKGNDMSIEYLFKASSFNKGVQLHGLEGYKIKLSVYKEAKKA